MQIQINYAGVAPSDALSTHIESSVGHAIGRFSERITRVEVHVRDLNSGKKAGPNDKRCLIEARPAHADPIAVEQEGDDYHAVVTGAAEKLGRAVKKHFEKLNGR
ncbi:MAG: HPF/RaiA family ribosome-associated protein [Phycisphaerales bacterium]|nr:HPF/RaiA family ribosome-associated protein [Phycisphaerales bacterium]